MNSNMRFYVSDDADDDEDEVKNDSGKNWKDMPLPLSRKPNLMRLNVKFNGSFLENDCDNE